MGGPQRLEGSEVMCMENMILQVLYRELWVTTKGHERLLTEEFSMCFVNALFNGLFAIKWS